MQGLLGVVQALDKLRDASRGVKSVFFIRLFVREPDVEVLVKKSQLAKAFLQAIPLEGDITKDPSVWMERDLCAARPTSGPDVTYVADGLPTFIPLFMYPARQQTTASAQSDSAVIVLRPTPWRLVL
jgi:hypothetical protein